MYKALQFNVNNKGSAANCFRTAKWCFTQKFQLVSLLKNYGHSALMCFEVCMYALFWYAPFILITLYSRAYFTSNRLCSLMLGFVESVYCKCVYIFSAIMDETRPWFVEFPFSSKLHLVRCRIYFANVRRIILGSSTYVFTLYWLTPVLGPPSFSSSACSRKTWQILSLVIFRQHRPIIVILQLIFCSPWYWFSILVSAEKTGRNSSLHHYAGCVRLCVERFILKACCMWNWTAK